MRLFLASHDVGFFGEKLVELIGKKQKVLIIPNARDYHEENKYIDNVVHAKVKMFAELGLSAAGLDLKRFFGKREKLEEFLNARRDVGMIYALGGDVFLLRTAMKLSGLDQILLEKLKDDEIAYGGSSAGSMLATMDLELYERDELRPEEVQKYYNVPAELKGLGLIDKVLIPHVDDIKRKQITQLYLEKAGERAVLLNDSDVYLVNNDNSEILRG